MVTENIDPTPAKTYLELSKIIKFLNITISTHDLDISRDFVSLVGLYCLGIDDKGLQGYKCRANHYLQDALGTEQLPSFSSIGDEAIDIVSFNKLHAAIKNCGSEQKINEISFKTAANRIATAVLHTLREYDIIKGEDKYFSSSQKQKLSEEGYLIVPSVLSKDEVEKLSELTLFIAEKEDEANASYRYGGTGNKLQRVYNLISKHPAYVGLLEIPILKEVLEYHFDKDNFHHKYVLSSFQSNIIYPGGRAQQLHVDGFGVSSNPLPTWDYRLNANFLLTDWTENNGATLLAPKSHKLHRAPEPEEIPDSKLLKVIAPKGSLVFWTGHTWHKSGTNNSDHPRFGLFACFATSQLKEVSTEEEHLSVVDKEVMDNLSPELRFMIGLDRGVKKGALHRVDFKGTKFDNFNVVQGGK